MKIRIYDNRMRLRLSKSEVSQLVQKGEVSAQCQIIGGTLDYKLIRGQYSAIKASFENNTISVFIPDSLTLNWDQDERVGFDGTDTNGLYILIEKDFQCLSPRDEDEGDLYLNPEAIAI